MASFVDTTTVSPTTTPLSPGLASSAKNAMTTLLKSSIESQLLVERTKEANTDSTYDSNEVNLVINDDDELARLLIARDNDVPKATKMALEMIRLRTKFDVMNLQPEEFPIALGQGNLRWGGYDKEGSPILVCRAALWKPWVYENGATASRQYSNFIFYMLSMLTKSMNRRSDQFVLIFKMNSYNARMMGTTAMTCTKAMIDVVQKCFPERVKSAYLIEHPKLFSVAWKALRLLIAEKTRCKVHFLDGSVDVYGPKLLEIIDTQNLEADLGGTKDGFFPKQEFSLPEELKRIGISLS